MKGIFSIYALEKGIMMADLCDNRRMKIERAEEKDIPSIMRIIDQAKRWFHDQKIDQWQNGYPLAEDIRKDIENRGSYVIKEDEKVIGTCLIRQMEDPTYAVIEDGRWLNADPYLVIHRTAVDMAYKGKGYASLFIKKAEELAKKENIHNLRADTHRDNHSMRRLLEKNGFVRCGIIYTKDGSPREAYQKVL